MYKKKTTTTRFDRAQMGGKEQESKTWYVLTQQYILLLTPFYVTGSFIDETAIAPRGEDLESCKITAWEEVKFAVFVSLTAFQLRRLTSPSGSDGNKNTAAVQ